jgi:hypothetical protein
LTSGSTPRRRPILGATAAIALATLFVIANRGAYEGFFSGDDLDNLYWTSHTAALDFLWTLLSPVYSEMNFRPAGHFYFWALGRLAHLNFPVYVAVVQALHLTASMLIYAAAHVLGAARRDALAASLFYVFHTALFDAFWKPMFVFDVLCCILSVASLILWVRGRWILSFAAFLLAYKSKELAVMLPAVLLLYEYTLGEKRWKRLLPFFAMSAVFGLQALAFRHAGDVYTLRFTPASLRTTVVFYAERVMVLVWLAPAVLVLALVRDRRVWFGLGAAALLIVPLLALPGRLFAVYWYVPMSGIAIAFAFAAGRLRWQWLSVMLIAWLGFNFAEMRKLRRAALTDAQEAESYWNQLQSKRAGISTAEIIMFDGWPKQFDWWGCWAAVRMMSGVSTLDWASGEDANLAQKIAGKRTALIAWRASARQLSILEPESMVSYIDMDGDVPIWRLERGWYGREGRYRWIQPEARVRLERPAHAKRVEVQVLIGPQYIERVREARLKVSLNGVPLGDARFTEHGWRTLSWQLPAGPPATATIGLSVTPAFHPGPSDPRLLGLPIGAIGFR